MGYGLWVTYKHTHTHTYIHTYTYITPFPPCTVALLMCRIQVHVHLHLCGVKKAPAEYTSSWVHLCGPLTSSCHLNGPVCSGTSVWGADGFAGAAEGLGGSDRWGKGRGEQRCSWLAVQTQLPICMSYVCKDGMQDMLHVYFFCTCVGVVCDGLLSMKGVPGLMVLWSSLQHDKCPNPIQLFELRALLVSLLAKAPLLPLSCSWIPWVHWDACGLRST